MVEVLAQGGPGDVEFDVSLLLDAFLLHGVVQGAHGGALAHDLQGHALEDVAHAAAVGDQRLGGPAQHVDEPGSYREAAHVNLSLPLGVPSSAVVTQGARRVEPSKFLLVPSDKVV